jgi:hypothetical protein
MHALPGGLCTSWQRDGYTIDCCIHVNRITPRHRSLTALARSGLIQRLKLINHDEFVRVEFADGPR